MTRTRPYACRRDCRPGGLTIVNLVSAGLGVAIVPKWTSRMAARGVRYVRLAASEMNKLALAAGRTRGTRDPIREKMLGMLKAHPSRSAREASFKKTDP